MSSSSSRDYQAEAELLVGSVLEKTPDMSFEDLFEHTLSMFIATVLVRQKRRGSDMSQLNVAGMDILIVPEGVMAVYTEGRHEQVH